MKSIIKEIFYGNRGNGENIKFSAEHLKADEKALGKYEEFKSKLSPELAKEFDDFLNSDLETDALSLEEHFIEAFKIGVMLGVECASE